MLNRFRQPFWEAGRQHGQLHDLCNVRVLFSPLIAYTLETLHLSRSSQMP